uniref:Putative secreted peptide n=1 Tax=Anopheles braziliensis TaxID=58242 RepID=A0A2M3ZV72_9DIPT
MLLCCALVVVYVVCVCIKCRVSYCTDRTAGSRRSDWRPTVNACGGRRLTNAKLVLYRSLAKHDVTARL